LGIKITFGKEPSPAVEHDPNAKLIDQFKFTKTDRLMGLVITVLLSGACIYGYELNKHNGWRWLFVFLGMALVKCLVAFWKLEPYDAMKQETDQPTGDVGQQQ
jgi:hypothetical protein